MDVMEMDDYVCFANLYADCLKFNWFVILVWKEYHPYIHIIHSGKSTFEHAKWSMPCTMNNTDGMDRAYSNSVLMPMLLFRTMKKEKKTRHYKLFSSFSLSLLSSD